jgi:hypothetical protein
MAKRKDPGFLWERSGHEVRRADGEIRAYGPDGRCAFRSTLTARGTWVSSAADAGVPVADGVGDNISLAMHLFGVGFPDAVAGILAGRVCAGAAGASPAGRPRAREQARPAQAQAQAQAQAAPLRAARPRVPEQSSQAVRACADYLAGREVSPETLAYAIDAGFVRCVGEASYATLLFTGRDARGDVRSAFRRGTADEAKRDLKDSDKRFPPLIAAPGAPLVITEGGVSALSALELVRLTGPGLRIGAAATGCKYLPRETPADGPLAAALRAASQIVFLVEPDVADGMLRGKYPEGRSPMQANMEIAARLAPETPVSFVVQSFGDANDLLRDPRGRAAFTRAVRGGDFAAAFGAADMTATEAAGPRP